MDCSDPLRKREEFAVSLRKQKTREIIKEKRRKIMESLSKQKDSLKQIEEEDFDSEFLGWLDINDTDDSQGHKAF